jgi:hypothetical protein
VQEFPAKGCLGCGLLLVLVALAGGLWLARETASEKAAGAVEDRKLEAFVLSQEYVRQRLKSPSTAKFPWASMDFVRVEGQRYQITAYVDAQNVLGATVRTNYVCLLEREGEEAWSLLDLQLWEP